MKQSFALIVFFTTFVAKAAFLGVEGLSMMQPKRSNRFLTTTTTASALSRVQQKLRRRLFRRTAGANEAKIQGYVPDGLTREDYRRLKEQEAKRQAGMKYGAWGPRFHPTQEQQPPAGDWMAMPQLWTSGIVPMSQPVSSSVSRTSKRQRLATWSRKTIPAYVLALAAVNVFVVSASYVSLWGPKVVLGTVTPWRKIAAIVASQIVTYAVLTKPIQMYLESTSRRLLWSQRRTYLVTAAPLVVVALLLVRGSSALPRVL